MNPQVLEEIVSGFWEFRVMKQASNTTLPPLDELLFEYLLTRHQSNEGEAVEEGYNLRATWSRCGHDPYMQLFVQIMTGEVEVEVIDKWISSQVKLMEALRKSSPTKVTRQFLPAW